MCDQILVCMRRRPRDGAGRERPRGRRRGPHQIDRRPRRGLRGELLGPARARRRARGDRGDGRPAGGRGPPHRPARDPYHGVARRAAGGDRPGARRSCARAGGGTGRRRAPHRRAAPRRRRPRDDGPGRARAGCSRRRVGVRHGARRHACARRGGCPGPRAAHPGHARRTACVADPRRPSPGGADPGRPDAARADPGRPDAGDPSDAGDPPDAGGPPTPAGSTPAGATPPATPPTTPSVTPPDEIAVYVAPFGDDAAPGTAARPVATLSRALAIVPDRGVIRLAAGSYPAAYDQVRHAATVVVDARAATIAGLQFHGATNVTVVGGTFTGLVKIDANGLSRPSGGARHRRRRPHGGCVNIRDKARAIVVRNSRMHDCWTGVSGPGRVSAAYQSSDILIEDNLIEDMQSDGIQFGDWNDVTITGNTIRDIRDPAGVIHNDGIQFTGGTTGVRIVGNRISVASSMILIQPAIRPIDDVLVQGNTLGPNFAVTVQSQGVTRARFIGNTMCGGVLGGLWLRAASDGGAPDGHRRAGQRPLLLPGDGGRPRGGRRAQRHRLPLAQEAGRPAKRPPTPLRGRDPRGGMACEAASDAVARP